MSDVTWYEIIGMKVRKQFPGFEATLFHDEFVNDLLVVKVNGQADVGFRGSVDPVAGVPLLLKGYKFSWASLHSFTIRDEFPVPDELRQWVHEVSRTLQEHHERFLTPVL